MSAATLTAAESGCPFCKLVMERVTTGRGIEQIGSSGVYHFEPLNPVTPGHRLFVPAFHYEDAAEAPSATGAVFEWAAWWAAQQDEDFNLIVNAGPAASQTVRHLHVHYVPRRPSDGLILPWSSLAEKRAEWEAGQGDTEWEYGATNLFDDKPVSIRDALAEAVEAQAFYTRERGRKTNLLMRTKAVPAGPWLPVPGSTVRESDSGVRESDNEESEGKA